MLPRDAPLHALERAYSTKGNRATTRADDGTIAPTWEASKPLIFIPPAAGNAGIWLLTGLKQVSEVAQTYELVQEFQSMVQTRTPEPLDQWLKDCAASGIGELRTFARGIKQDYAAVRAALSLSASNGQTEGQVNRLKLIKRQGYGRAKFDLLRQRVLAAP